MYFTLIENNIGILIGALGSAWAAWLTYKNKHGTNTHDKFELLLESESKLISTLCSEIEGLKKEIAKYKLDIGDLNSSLLKERENILHLNHLIDSDFSSIKAMQKFCEYIPTPTWLKAPPINDDKYSRMIFINQAYEIEWSISKQSYEGKLDIDLWPKQVADEFAAHDLHVVDKKVSVITNENVPLKPFSDYDLNKLKKWVILKFPVFIDNVSAVGGIAIDLSNTKIKSNNIFPPTGGRRL